jgi:hypothetical protein
MSDAGYRETNDAARWRRRALGAGVAGLCAAAVGAAFDPAALLRGYVASWLFYLGITLGAMVLLMVYHLTGGGWGFLIRRILEAQMRTLPLVALLFLPIALGIRFIYPWAQPEAIAASRQLQYQQFYLAPTWFWLRAGAYFVIWLGIARWLSAWSREEDLTGDPRLAWKSRQLCAFGALAYGISLHFAAVDWGMSLQPVFHSTIWGPMLAAGQLLSALAFALVILAGRIDWPPLAEVASLKVRSDLASLLLTLLILWAYMAWFQFMLIWIANLPVDVVWYLPRASGLWVAVIWAIVLLHFAVPFFLLLMRPIKRNSKAVAWVAGLILAMQLVHDDYLVVPDAWATWRAGYWLALLTPIGLGGIWLAHFLWQLNRLPLVALNDYNRAAALHLRKLDEEDAGREEALLATERDQAAGAPAVAAAAGEGTAAGVAPEPVAEPAALGYETQDIRLGGLLALGACICGIAVLLNYGVWHFLRFEEETQAAIKKSIFVAAPASQPLPPQPRLEQIDRLSPPQLVTAEENDAMNKQLADEERALHRYGPAEPGFVHVPIEAAIKALAGKLPVAKNSAQGESHSEGLLDGGGPNSGRIYQGEQR